MSHMTTARKAAQHLRGGRRESIESVIRFLESDEYKFRSGYLKEYCWDSLKQAELTESQKHRLRQVALAYLHKRMRREFWYMCRYIRRIADVGFRTEVERLEHDPQPEVRQRASLLKAYLYGLENGEWRRKQFSYECFRARYLKPFS